MTDAQLPVRHRPPHHPPVERFNEPVIVLVSVCTKDRQPLLANESAHAQLRTVWKVAVFWRVGLYVIMPDHVHLFCVPGRIPVPSLKQWVEFWKARAAATWHWGAGAPNAGGPTSVSARKTDGTEPVPPKLWQRDFWDTQMRSREHYAEKLSYVRMNPVRQGLAEDALAWPFQGEIHPIAWL